jgi:hypothetical protein
MVRKHVASYCADGTSALPYLTPTSEALSPTSAIPIWPAASMRHLYSHVIPLIPLASGFTHCSIPPSAALRTARQITHRVAPENHRRAGKKKNLSNFFKFFFSWNQNRAVTLLLLIVCGHQGQSQFCHYVCAHESFFAVFSSRPIRQARLVPGPPFIAHLPISYSIQHATCPYLTTAAAPDRNQKEHYIPYSNGPPRSDSVAKLGRSGDVFPPHWRAIPLWQNLPSQATRRLQDDATYSTTYCYTTYCYYGSVRTQFSIHKVGFQRGR